MTAKRPPRDVPASVHARLRNLARRRDLDFMLVLGRYAAERFLYRLSASDEMHRFTLKGAALFRVWAEEEMRPTRDVDFLAAADHASVRAAIETMCAVPCPDDGVLFDAGALRIDAIRVDQPDGGLRLRLPGALGNIRLSLPMDVGFGDVVTPARELRDYPTLLDLPAPRLWTYPREAMVAEKFHALASRARPTRASRTCGTSRASPVASRSTARRCAVPSPRRSAAAPPRSPPTDRQRCAPPTTRTPPAESAGACSTGKSRPAPTARPGWRTPASSSAGSSGRSATA